MTFGEIKEVILKLIEEYVETADQTDDDDIKLRIDSIFYSEYVKASKVKGYLKTQEIDRGTLGETTYYREYSLPTDYQQIKSIFTQDSDTNELTTDADFYIRGEKIYINDLSTDKYVIEYDAKVTYINGATLDTFELELEPDVLILAAYGVADKILRTDISSDYSSFRSDYQLMKSEFDAKRFDSVISFDTEIIF